jgi:hypothetical protein
VLIAALVQRPIYSVMQLTAHRPYADPEAAAKKLLEIANSVEAVQTAESTSN